MMLRFELNGRKQRLEAHPAERLLDLLRRSGHTGTKEGCGEGECGACSVLLDGTLVNSCLVPVIQIDGRKILTIEAVDHDDILGALKIGFQRMAGAQCGICTPGMMLAAAALLMKHEDPDDEQIREALSGNLCRCTGYVKIVDSVHEAARMLRDEETAA